MAAFAAALTDGSLALALAGHFAQTVPPEISATPHTSFQQALWQLFLAWPQDNPALPSRLVMKAHPGRFSVWEFAGRDLGLAERMAARTAQAAGVQVPMGFDLKLGDHIFWVLPWVEGHKPASEEDFKTIGASLAAVHRQGERHPGLPVFSLHGFLDHVQHSLSQSGEDVAASLAARLKGCMADAAPVFAHGDPHQGNWIITKDGQAVLLDFEDAAFFPSARDLAVLERAAGDVALGAALAGYQAAGGKVPADLSAWHTLLFLQDFAIAAHIKSHLAAGVALPPMDVKNWQGLSVSSVDQIAAMLEE